VIRSLGSIAYAIVPLALVPPILLVEVEVDLTPDSDSRKAVLGAIFVIPECYPWQVGDLDDYAGCPGRFGVAMLEIDVEVGSCCHSSCHCECHTVDVV
jgi:hypothetical protein